MFWAKKPSISDDMRGWIEDSFDWADDTFGTTWSLSRLMVTPTKTFFSAGAGHTPDVAQTIADDIAALIPVPLVPVIPLNNLPPEYRHNYQDTAAIAGTYQEDDEGGLIHYDPALMAQPLAFINTMTHELMHHRLNRYVSVMPGGEGAHELSTDLHCITHGFGILALEGPSQVGWSGYMTRESRAFAFAYFLKKHGMDAPEAMEHLQSRNQKALKRALSELE